MILVWVVSSCSDSFCLKDRIRSQPITCVNCHPLDFSNLFDLSHLFSRDSAEGILRSLKFYPSEESSKWIHLPYFVDPRQFHFFSELRPDLPLKEEVPCDAGKPCCALSLNSISLLPTIVNTNPCCFKCNPEEILRVVSDEIVWILICLLFCQPNRLFVFLNWPIIVSQDSTLSEIHSQSSKTLTCSLLPLSVVPWYLEAHHKSWTSYLPFCSLLK